MYFLLNLCIIPHVSNFANLKLPGPHLYIILFIPYFLFLRNEWELINFHLQNAHQLIWHVSSIIYSTIYYILQSKNSELAIPMSDNFLKL